MYSPLGVGGSTTKAHYQIQRKNPYVNNIWLKPKKEFPGYSCPPSKMSSSAVFCLFVV